MGSLEIKEVTGERGRLAFIKMPWQVYSDDPNWVPPVIADQKTFLNPRKGVFFEHGQARLFMATRDGQPVGRISAHINSLHDELWHDGKGFFGFFECEDNQQTADALFASAEEYLLKNGKTTCEGPLNFGIYDEVGVLIDAFDSPPYVLNVHNPPYYRTLIENAGYSKSIDWFAFRGKLRDYEKVDQKMTRLKDRALSRAGLTVRSVNMKSIKKEADIAKSIFDSAWDKNWGHVPVTETEWRRLVHEMVPVLVPELTLIAEKNGNPVGFTITAYDANVAVKMINGRLYPLGFIKLLRNLKKTKKIRLFLSGVLEQYRGRGVEIALFMTVAQKGYEMGFDEMEMSLIVEDNEPMINSLKYFPVKVEKTYRIFKKPLAG